MGHTAPRRNRMNRHGILNLNTPLPTSGFEHWSVLHPPNTPLANTQVSGKIPGYSSWCGTEVKKKDATDSCFNSSYKALSCFCLQTSLEQPSHLLIQLGGITGSKNILMIKIFLKMGHIYRLYPMLYSLGCKMGRRSIFPGEKRAHFMRPKISLQFLCVCWSAVCCACHLHHCRTGLVPMYTSHLLLSHLSYWGYLFELDFTSWVDHDGALLVVSWLNSSINMENGRVNTIRNGDEISRKQSTCQCDWSSCRKCSAVSLCYGWWGRWE